MEETHLLFLYLETPVPTKNTLDTIGKSVKNFLQNISFPGTFVFPRNSDLDLPAGIRMMIKGNTAISYDITEYKGLL